jgi:hypothetical protein
VQYAASEEKLPLTELSLEERRHSDIATGRDEVDYQTHPAVNEKHDAAHQYGDQIKDTRNSGLKTR